MSSVVLAEPADSSDRYRSLCEALGYSFADNELLDQALTHRSWCAENGGRSSNERLEFVGDAVLGMAITEALFTSRPEQPEGDLAKARAEVVSTKMLAEVAHNLNLGDLLFLGRGEDLSGGREKDSILADATEAVFAAVFIDGGWEPAREVVLGQLGTQAREAQTTPGERDFKTRLQEFAALHSLPLPHYDVEISGPDHGRKFVSTVRIDETVGTGHGTSKKQAQQAAAQDILGRLNSANDAGTGDTEAALSAAKGNDEG